jgi:ornithine cyclodeaminase
LPRYRLLAEILFSDPPGEAHIKAGHIAGDAVFVVKVATGFYRNPAIGLSSSSGLMIAFDATTGVPKAVLLDRGKLTDLRTAAAGAVAAKLLAPRNVSGIAIFSASARCEPSHQIAKRLAAEAIPSRQEDHRLDHAPPHPM